jgi:CDP-diacylglycerol--glycerol-3-phosphate 3-phosphatidyltransferase
MPDPSSAPAPTDFRRHIPNILTLSRLAWAILFFIVISNWSYAASPLLRGEQLDWYLIGAALLFAIAAATDFLDGYLARKWNVVSAFGRIMDPFADKLLIIGGFILLAGPSFTYQGSQVSGVFPWMAIVILGRELLVTSLRAAVEGKGHSFAATASGKWKMILQSAAIPAILILLHFPDQSWAGYAIRILAWTTTIVTAWSGVPYIVRAIVALRASGVGGPPAHPGLTPMEEFWITSFGLGYLRPAPGTWGSLPPVGLAAILVWSGVGPAHHPMVYNLAMGAVVVGYFIICAYLGPGAEQRYGRKDPSHVVADETAGMAMTLMFLPAAAVSSFPMLVFTLGFAFVAFRILDILKPYPAYQIQKLPGGWGVVLDDLVSGFYALLLVQLLTRGLL